MVRFYFVDRHRLLREPARGRLARLRRAAALVVLVPFDLVWSLPRDVARTFRQGRAEEFVEYLRGLRDGWCDRPIPFQRLGLR
jgi:hypothetical protein